MTRTRTLGTLATVVGFLAFVEFTSGVLQGFTRPCSPTSRGIWESTTPT